MSVRGGRCGRGDGVEKLQGGARGGEGGGHHREGVTDVDPVCVAVIVIRKTCSVGSMNVDSLR